MSADVVAYFLLPGHGRWRSGAVITVQSIDKSIPINIQYEAAILPRTTAPVSKEAIASHLRPSLGDPSLLIHVRPFYVISQ